MRRGALRRFGALRKQLPFRRGRFREQFGSHRFASSGYPTVDVDGWICLGHRLLQL